MKTIFTFLQKILSTTFSKKKPPQVPCSFCGEVGHGLDDCPKAGKYKLFNVDRE